MEKVKFYSAYNLPTGEGAPTGDGFEPKYQISIDEVTGHKDLNRTGTTNMYAKIQENAEDCKIENLIARANAGDTSVYQAKCYADVSNAPKTLAAAQSMIQTIQNEFNSLPLEIRAKYNHSVSEYVAAYGSESWAKVMGIIKEEPNKLEEQAPNMEGGEVNE